MCNKECNRGTFGYECVNTCHCLNISSCDKRTGTCDGGCTPGYINNNCSTNCPYKYFGMNCTERCSGHCINNKTCDHVSGECSDGCLDGYIGLFCNETCIDGYYGPDCSKKCQSNCRTCRHTDGMCTCDAGWIGPKCNSECVWSYGEDCQYPCHRHCLNQTCDRFNGSCLYGFSDEYIYCELGKIKSYNKNKSDINSSAH
nr:multiple epidermal growth factor-like domains protein 10 [Crassostrea gigas]